MKLAVSNIAWPSALDSEVLASLREKEIAAVEVAPTKWWREWVGAGLPAARDLQQSYALQGFAIPSFQAILFSRPEHKLFGTEAQREQLLDHLKFCADLAQTVSARCLVFGAPKNRELNGLPEDRAFEMARELFVAAGDYYATRGAILCMEANPKEYGCQFVTNSRDAAKLVRAVESPGFGLHLDTACMHLAQEDIGEAIEASQDILRHFHVSEPYLGGFEGPVCNHEAAATALRKIGYQGWVSLEMREQTTPVQAVNTAVDYLKTVYGGGR